MVQGLSPHPPRMQAQVYIDPEVPCYVVVEKRGFVDDQDRLWMQGERLYWEGKPSMALDPLNDLAEDKMREHLEFLDKLADQVNERKGTSHASLVNAYEARRRIKELDKRHLSPDRQEMTPIMGARRSAKRMARSLEEGPQMPPMMGHQARYSVAPQQASAEPATRGRPRKGLQKTDPNPGRAAVNADDKGF